MDKFRRKSKYETCISLITRLREVELLLYNRPPKTSFKEVVSYLYDCLKEVSKLDVVVDVNALKSSRRRFNFNTSEDLVELINLVLEERVYLIENYRRRVDEETLIINWFSNEESVKEFLLLTTGLTYKWLISREVIIPSFEEAKNLEISNGLIEFLHSSTFKLLMQESITISLFNLELVLGRLNEETKRTKGKSS